MEFNEKLKELRTDNNMTQDDLASLLHISRQSVSKWEMGISEPDINTLKKLCEIFNVSISLLLGMSEDKVLNKNDRFLIKERKVFISIVVFSLIGLLFIPILLKMMKDVIPMHYDFFGNITRYGSKYESLFFLIFYALFFGVSSLIHFKYAKKHEEAVKTYFHAQIMILILIILTIIGNIIFSIYNAKDIRGDLIAFISSIMTALFIVLSIFSSPKFNKRNPAFGFRTHFTITNDIAWYKINKFQSITAFIVSTILYIISIITFKHWNIYLIGAIVVSVIPTFIYHEVLRNKFKKGLLK